MHLAWALLNGVAGAPNCTRANELAVLYMTNYSDWDVQGELAGQLLR